MKGGFSCPPCCTSWEIRGFFCLCFLCLCTEDPFTALCENDILRLPTFLKISDKVVNGVNYQRINSLPGSEREGVTFDASSSQVPCWATYDVSRVFLRIASGEGARPSGACMHHTMTCLYRQLCGNWLAWSKSIVWNFHSVITEHRRARGGRSHGVATMENSVAVPQKN